MAPKAKAADTSTVKPSKTGVSNKSTEASPSKKAGNNKISEKPSELIDKDLSTDVAATPHLYLMPVVCAGEPYRSIASLPCHPENKLEPSLHRAITDHRLVHARYLIAKRGMSVNKVDMFGMTPMLLISQMEDESYALSVAKLLYKYGADVNACDSQGRRPLHHCCLEGRSRLASWLLKIEVINFASWDCFGYTSLMYSCMRGGDPCLIKGIVARYIHCGINVDAYRREGFTAMMLACRYGNYASAYVLLTCGGAQATMRNDEEFLSAREWAQWSSRQDMVQPHIQCAEKCIDGMDSLSVLLKELQQAEERMSVKGDQGDSAQQAACLPGPSYPPPSTPLLLSLGLMPVTGMRPDLPSILSLYIHDDVPIYDCRCYEESSEDIPAPEEAPVLTPIVTASAGKAPQRQRQKKVDLA